MLYTITVKSTSNPHVLHPFYKPTAYNNLCSLERRTNFVILNFKFNIKKNDSDECNFFLCYMFSNWNARVPISDIYIIYIYLIHWKIRNFIILLSLQCFDQIFSKLLDSELFTFETDIGIFWSGTYFYKTFHVKNF